MLLFVFLYLVAKAVETTLSLMSTEYSTLSFENKRNAVTCESSHLIFRMVFHQLLPLDILNTLMTTIALGFQLIAIPTLISSYSVRGEAGMTVTANIISALCMFLIILYVFINLYIWEQIFLRCATAPQCDCRF